MDVTAKALLPSTSVISFTLGRGLSFTTFVNTVPIDANRTINRFALIRRLDVDPIGAAIFNSAAWDSMARQAMIKCVPSIPSRLDSCSPCRCFLSECHVTQSYMRMHSCTCVYCTCATCVLLSCRAFLGAMCSWSEAARQWLPLLRHLNMCFAC